jgi:hypothetical protein
MIVPDSEWDRPEEKYNGDYTILTIDGREINAETFARTDSSVIIYKLKGEKEGTGASRIELPINDIESIKETKFWWLGTIVGIPVLSLVAYTAFLALLGIGLSNASW